MIHRNRLSVGRGKPKIAGADCHTIGLDCTVQLCSEPVCLPVCHLTDCRTTVNLSGASSLKCGLQSAPRKFISQLFPETQGSKTKCVRGKVHCSFKQFFKMHSSFDYHNATMAEFKAGIVQLQIWRETTPCLTSEERNKARVGEKEKDRGWDSNPS